MCVYVFLLYLCVFSYGRSCLLAYTCMLSTAKHVHTHRHAQKHAHTHKTFRRGYSHEYDYHAAALLDKATNMRHAHMCAQRKTL
jgi:hypothetical protein